MRSRPKEHPEDLMCMRRPERDVITRRTLSSSKCDQSPETFPTRKESHAILHKEFICTSHFGSSTAERLRWWTFPGASARRSVCTARQLQREFSVDHIGELRDTHVAGDEGDIRFHFPKRQ